LRGRWSICSSKASAAITSLKFTAICQNAVYLAEVHEMSEEARENWQWASVETRRINRNSKEVSEHSSHSNGNTMSINRRSFLRYGAASPSLLMMGLSKGRAQSKSVEADSSWDNIRQEFNLDSSMIHMSGLFLASHPRSVRDTIAKYRRALDENPPSAWRKFRGREAAAREAAAHYLASNADEIALTDSTTMGLGLLYGGMLIRKDQEIISTLHDHSSTHSSLDYKAMAVGCSVRRIALFEKSSEANKDEIVKRIREAIRENTRVVAVTFVHSSSGLKLPLTDIGAMIQNANEGRALEDRVLFCVDGVHGLGVEDFQMRELGCDFFVAGCHKWLFGPRGTGILWGRKESWSQIIPIIPSFSGKRSAGRLMTPGGFHSFEHRWALSEAFDFHLAIGKQRVQERIHTLATLVKKEFASIRGLILHTPQSPALSSGIVCFEIAGLTPRDIVRRLRQKKITASTTPYAVSYARLAPGLLNSDSEVEQTIAAVKEIAAEGQGNFAK
jgi:selenocysteine lyase/cysteine desulfurase